MVEEVGELKLGDELPKGRLQEFGGCEECVNGFPGYPFIEFGARTCTKKEVLLTMGS